MIKLREIEQRDIEDVAKHLNNANVSKYLTTRIPFPYGQDDAKWWVTTGSKEGINKIIEANNNFIGVVGVTPGIFDNERSAEIGYWVGEEFWGNGYATAALSIMTEEIFENTNIVRLFAPVYSPNMASIRVLEKSGYYQESIQRKALFKNELFYDAHVYAKVNS